MRNTRPQYSRSRDRQERRYCLVQAGFILFVLGACVWVGRIAS